MTFSSIRTSWYSHLISLCLMVTFVTTMVITPRAYAQGGVMGLPEPGTMVNLSPAYVPLMVTGLTIHPENPLLMDFIVSTGNSGLNAVQVKKESDRLIKYFLACLTIPENNQWVNLSPYEKDRIVPEDLGQTVLGQDMLSQDYLLKQLTASLIYPEKNLGKNFWDKVYSKASQIYGTTQIPVNTFNKVWILPDTAKVFEHKDTVFVVKSHLKVMLDEDYLARNRHSEGVRSTTEESKGVLRSFASAQDDKAHTLASNIIRQIILPAIEQEVNNGQNFAQLRQIYNSMILAVWFKKNLKQALLNQVYTDKSKVNGVNVDDPTIKEKIYKQYLQAYKKGVFNYIKEESFPPLDGEGRGGVVIPRKYFSGGLTPERDVAMATSDEMIAAFHNKPHGDQEYRVSGSTEDASKNPAINPDLAMHSMKYSQFESAVGLERINKFLGSIIGQYFIKSKMSGEDFDRAFARIVDDTKEHTVFDSVFIDLVKIAESKVGKGGNVNTREILIDHIRKHFGELRVMTIKADWFNEGFELSRHIDNKGIKKNNHALALAAIARTLSEWGAAEAKGDKAQISTYHEQRGQELVAYANRTNGALPMPTHAIKKMFRVADVPLNLMNVSLDQKRELWKIAWNYLQQLSARNGHITWGVMAGGSASRMAKGRLTQILIDAVKEDPEQFVDVTKFNRDELTLIKEVFGGDYKKYIQSLNPDVEADHEVLNRVLHESKALLPADRPIDGKWYNLLGYNAINVKRVNDELEAKGLKRLFIFKVMPNDGNYLKILQNLVQNNFYGLKVSVIKDADGNVIDIDHTDVTNELVMYNQGLGFRIVAPVKTVEAQWEKDKVLIEQAGKETDVEKRATLLGSAQLKSEAAYKYALAFSHANEGKVLYNALVAEGHGERFHALFETTSVGPQIPMIIQDILRGVEYDYFHNIDNMASLNDDWMLIFGHMIKNNLLMTLEGSLRPSTERGGGGGFDWTEIDDGHGGKELVYRQTEDNVTRPSLGKDPDGNPISPEYDQKAEDERVSIKVDGIPNQVPVNNASELNKVLTLATVRNGEDIISVNLSPKMRQELADALQQAIDTQNYKVDLRKFSAATRQRFGVVSTIKSVADPNVEKPSAEQQLLTVVSETFAWSSEEGALPGQRMHVILTPSIVDVQERGLDPQTVRFDPLKDRLTYDNPLAQSVRGALLRRNVKGVLFSDDFNQALDVAMRAQVEEALKVRLSGQGIVLAGFESKAGGVSEATIKKPAMDAQDRFMSITFTPKIDVAMEAEVQIRPGSKSADVSSENQQVAIKVKGTAGWRTFLYKDGKKENGEGPFNMQNVGRATAALATKLNEWVQDGSYTPVRGDGKLHALIAYDGRPNGVEFANHAARVAFAYGMDVDISSDYIATPDGLFETRRSLGENAYDVVIVVTASHNNYLYDGLKIGMNGSIMPDKFTGQIDNLANDAAFREKHWYFPGEVEFKKVDLKERASERYQKAFSHLPAAVPSYLAATGKKLFVDFMHGSGGRFADEYVQMGAEVRKVEPMREDTFPKQMFMENGKQVPYRPQPIREMLDQELTTFETASDVPEGSIYGAIDGDADRFAAWIKQAGKARELSPNEVMLLTLWNLKRTNRLPPGLKHIVVTAPTSYMVRRYAESIGLQVIETPVGSKYLGPHMNGEDPNQADLVWEESGHGGFRMVLPSGEEITFFDDANAQSLYFLDIVSSLPKGQDVLSVLDQLRKEMNYTLNYDKIPVDATDAAKDKIRVPLKNPNTVREIVANISQALGKNVPGDDNIVMTTSDEKQTTLSLYSKGGVVLNLNEGLKLLFNDGSWVQIRMSGTEPIIRIYGEFNDANPRAILNHLAKEVFGDQAMGATYEGASYLFDPDDELGLSEVERIFHEAQGGRTNVQEEVMVNADRRYVLVRGKLPRDRAANAKIPEGGIDLNSRGLKMESEGQKVNITFDAAMVAQFKRGDFSGVRFRVLDVEPINLMPMLGLKEDEETGKLAKA